MSFDELGFLSPSLNWKVYLQQTWPQHHALCHQVSELCMATLKPLAASRRLDTRNKLVVAYYIRLIQLLQGSISEMEHGMVTNAGTLLRAGFETLFFLSGTIYCRGFFDVLLQDYTERTDKYLRMLIEESKGKPDYATSIVGFERGIKETWEGFNTHKAALLAVDPARKYEPMQIKYDQLARKVGLSNLYASYYRGLSQEEAHSNLSALIKVFDPKTGGVRHGPAEGDYEQMLKAVVVLGAFALEKVSVCMVGRLLREKVRQIGRNLDALFPA